MDRTLRPTPSSLIGDPGFRAFVAGTDPEAVHYWTDWIERHPDRQAEVQEAMRVVKAMQQYQPRPDLG
ncbi:hypothetical protein GCM10023187_56410 [Nibrella viscosa]|uniref:Uncharacterized protein n=1 Tax=Nibrella viscosa TaxID=1084524 RepID=A0ABP8L3I1_9BACT